jgi:hypothetical protein
MIDEHRDDGVDNDGDWDPLTDDLGLDGLARTGDFGEGDGRATSGWQRPGAVPGAEGASNAFGLVDTELPGEPHIDKTDISESDMIGLTSFYLYSPWTLLPASNDELIWEMTKPGYLNDKSKPADTDFTFGSGYFPMVAGSIERFSVAHLMGMNLEDLVVNKRWGERAYRENYNFSKAPNIPTLTAVPGDDRVTLIWDDFAEQSVDPITGEDFEGYRVYRSTDPGFNDMTPVTDGSGSVTYRRPMAQFDRVDAFQGYAPVHVKGIEFWLGENTGLTHTYVDTTARNGFTYYYAVTSYDHGDPANSIPPSECAKYIAVSAAGEIDKGTNVVIARPEAPSAGYLAANLDSLGMASGSTSTGRISYEVIDPASIKDGHRYRVTFEDTMVTRLIGTANQSTRITKSVTIADVTDPLSPDTLIDRSRNVGPGAKQDPVHGFALSLWGDSLLVVDARRSGWLRTGLHPYLFAPYKFTKVETVPEPWDIRIEFGNPGADTSESFMRSTKNWPAVPVNFKVYKGIPGDSGTVWSEAKFAFIEQDGKDNNFSAFTDRKLLSDQIIVLNEAGISGFMFTLDRAVYDSLAAMPEPGDVAEFRLIKPFLSNDAVEFVTKPERMDEAQAKEDLERIKVVPNPYVVANSWESPNLYTSGRGPREIHFTHLPMTCTIKIFNVRGQLVRTIEHRGTVRDGSEVWDMRTKDQLDIAYGVYVYHVDAGRLGSKIGKFAVIK